MILVLVLESCCYLYWFEGKSTRWPLLVFSFCFYLAWGRQRVWPLLCMAPDAFSHQKRKVVCQFFNLYLCKKKI